MPNDENNPPPLQMCQSCFNDSEHVEDRTWSYISRWDRNRVQQRTSPMCGECWDRFRGDRQFTCGSCEQVLFRDSEWQRYRVMGEDGSEAEWCQVCVSEHNLCYCSNCSLYFDPNVQDHLVLDVDGMNFACEVCRNQYEHCPDCDEYFLVEDFHDPDEHGCMDRRNEGSGHIRYYSYTPSPLYFHSDATLPTMSQPTEPTPKQLYMGMELEVAIERGKMDDAANGLMDNAGQFLYLKDDCSINERGHRGFEIVTHPFTWPFIRDYPQVWEALDELRDENGGYNPDNCGMHVHVSRSAFTPSHLWRFLTFQYLHRDKMVELAGRDSGQWASWRESDQRKAIDYAKGPMMTPGGYESHWVPDPSTLRGPDGELVYYWIGVDGMVWGYDAYRDVPCRCGDPDCHEMASRYVQVPLDPQPRRVTPHESVERWRARDWTSARYSSINTGNQHTLELRYWSSTLDTEELKGRLQFIDALYNWTRELGPNNVQVKKERLLTWDRFTSWSTNGVADQYQELNGLLERKELLVA